MAFHPKYKAPKRYGVVTMVKTAVLVAGVASLGLVAWRVAQVTWPLMKASAEFELEGQLSNSQAAPEATEVSSTTGIAVRAARVPAVAAFPVWSFGFFRAQHLRRAIRGDALAP